MRKILLTFSLLIVLFSMNIGVRAGDTLYISRFEDGSSNMSGSSSTRTINSTSTYVRTGNRSQKIAVTNSSNGWGYGRLSLTYTKGTYIHVIAWVYSSAANRFYIKTNSAGGSDPGSNNITATTWTRFTQDYNFTGTTGAKNTDFMLYRGNGACDYYLDDVIIYYDNTSTTDLTAPTSATSPSATTSTISWENGSDAATGIQKTLIFRRTSGTSDDLTLNNQGNYLSSNYRSTTDQSGHWTVVSASVASDATSYSGSFTAGDRYAIVHRDLAYNYSSPTYVTIVDGGASCTVSSAEAGANKSTTVNTAVALAATAAGSGKTGTWSITSKPDGSTASTSSFSDVNSATATFTPDKVGDYTLTWTVECDEDDTETASDNMTVTANCIAISPTLSYASVGGTTLDVGDSSSGSPTVSGNTGSGSVSYAVTTASPAGCLTVNASTGVASAVAAGSATVTATIAASGNYCGNTATANFTIADDCTDPGLTITLN